MLDGWDAFVVCRDSEISGIWSPIKKAIDMPSYDTLEPKKPDKKRPRVSAESVNEMFYCPYCPNAKPYTVDTLLNYKLFCRLYTRGI